MTIKNFAKERNISYDRAYRAAKAVILASGRSMNAGRIPTYMSNEDVRNADEWMLDVGKRTPSNKVKDRKEFERLRREWMEKWTSKLDPNDPKKSETIFSMLGLLSGASGVEWFTRPWGVARLGDTVLRLAMNAGIDFEGCEGMNEQVPWVGFTRWLYDQGYDGRKS